MLGGNCPSNTVAGYRAFAAAGSSGGSKHSEQNRKPSGGICVLSAPRWETVVPCLPLLPRQQVHTITINISRCGWSLSSFHPQNMVLNTVFCRGGADGRMPKVFCRPVFLSVLQTAGSSSSSLSRVPAKRHHPCSENRQLSIALRLQLEGDAPKCLSSEGSVPT